MRLSKQSGFNLIELLIVVTIIGILAAIAYPSYNEQVMKARRSDAHTGLLNLSALMEHYFTENNSYTGATPAGVGGSAFSQEGHYALSISNLTATSYTLTATPVAGGAQATDSCGALTLTSTNIKGPNPQTCW